MTDQKSLADVKHFDGIKKEVACKVYIVGRRNHVRQYYTIAENHKVAALAFVSILDADNVAIQVSDIWVKDEDGHQSVPLQKDNAASVANWLAEDPSRATLIQAAVKHFNAITTA